MENGTQHGTKINKSWNCYYYCYNKTLPRNYAHWKQGKLFFHVLYDIMTPQKLRHLDVKRSTEYKTL
jgi:membrane-bound metal-dependent hydrolase YbcI (DUF457 family)